MARTPHEDYIRAQCNVLFYLHTEWHRGCDNGMMAGGMYALLYAHYWYLPLAVSESLSQYAQRDRAGRRHAIAQALGLLEGEIQRLAALEAADLGRTIVPQYAAYIREIVHRRQVPADTAKRGPQSPTINLRTMPYDAYLRTDHWQRVRKAAIERADHRCQLCNAKAKLEVHHRTYERRGCERDNDVIALCANCHEEFHKRCRDFAASQRRGIRRHR